MVLLKNQVVNTANPDIDKRLARVEQACAIAKSETKEAVNRAYMQAVEDEDEETAAAYARKLRDMLLAESDATMLIDRMGLETPSGSTFKDWLPFLNGIASATTGSVAQYRQALRDVPEQEGFPLRIVWPQI